MKLFVLLNPSRPDRLWDLREAAGQAARRHGATARFGQIDRTTPDSARRLLHQGIEEGCRRVVIVGGDGTIHRALNALHAERQLARLEVAIVPAGTCNDFARGLGWNARRPQEAFEAACTGSMRPTDLGVMTAGERECVFLNNAGFGRRASVVAKRRFSALRSLRSFEPTTLKLRWDKGELAGDFLMLLACNAPYFSKGLYFSRNPRVNDGLLNIYLVPTMARWRLMSLLLKGRLRRPVGNRRVLRLSVPHLEVEASRDLYPQADGEPAAGPVRRVTFSIAPEKVMIVLPERARSTFLWA